MTDQKGMILGATIVGAAAGELITAWTLAINQGLNIRAFAEIVVPYPTYAEIGKRAAITFFTPRLTSTLGAAHHELAAPVWLRSRSRDDADTMTHGRRPQRDGPRPRGSPARLGLSGKLLVLTILFVMIAEVLIYVPSIANFRLNWLNDRLAAAHTAALVLDAAPSGMVPESLARQILDSVGARAVAMKMGTQRRLLAVSDMPPMIHHDIDMRDVSLAPRHHRCVRHAAVAATTT